MRSQRFDFEGNRIGIGPHSGDAPTQGSVQSGDGRHLFSPTGFLDGDWFHRSYWVFGKSFAGGHNGYYQAENLRLRTNSRAMVKMFMGSVASQYYKWTTTLEHQLFSAEKEFSSGIDESTLPSKDARRGGETKTGSGVSFPLVPLNPTGKPLAVEAWVKAEKASGVIVARGGPANGFALVVHRGKPWFMVRSDEKLYR